MIQTREALKEQLRRREIAPVYLLFGAETYLRDLAVKTISDYSFAPDDFRDFNEGDVTLETVDDLAGALAAAQQLPMMASKRVIRVHGVRVSATGFRDTVTEAHESLIKNYLADPSDSTVLILIADELNGVRKMGKFLRENVLAVEFARLDDRQLAEWMRKEIASAGGQIDDVALRSLLARVEPDLRRISNEIKKLVAAAMPGGLITLKLIDALVPHSRELSNFDLTDHLVAGRKTQALNSLEKVLDDGAEPLALLGLISYNFRRLLIAKEMMLRSEPRQEIASAVKLFGRGQDDFFAAARKAEHSKLTRAIKRIANVDLAIKTSIGGSPRLQLEMLVCELAL